ncbi:MAG: type II toxin-antitoxin system VapC family toxin [Betaproteobacteria bacterium]|nr:MAG: type II toxin-antitoxin system VapC family toxin [Betaproteobacteria bacterium]
MAYLLDTNVISEPMRARPDMRIVAWLNGLENAHISALTLGEIRKGIEGAIDAKRKNRLESWLENQLIARFETRIHHIDAVVADRWGRIVANTPRPLPVMDSLFAATALTHDLILATRNVRDFADIAGLRLYDPWSDD